ncbi:MAG: hypothetical protein OEX11_02995 [Nitrosomonas sp.]|nr:hypothetical protein [Nitrosomonas sp.]
MKTEVLQIQISQWQQQLRWQIARLGAVGKIGVGLFVVAGIFFLAAVLPQKTELEALKERANTLQLKPQQAARAAGEAETVTSRKIGGDQALQIFYEFFPRIDSSPFWIRELVRVAKKQGVEVNSSDFRLSIDKSERLARYEMILPIRGRYPQIRAFIADALEAVPAMAITGMAMKRENVQSTQLEVRLEISLYLDE